jgi:CRP-like cAMP-binding protein
MPVSDNNGATLLTTDKSTCMNCRKKKHSLICDLSFDELVLLNNNKYEVLFKAGETICKEGMRPQSLLCLNKGKVKIIRTRSNGNEQIVALKKPVDFIGFRALMGGNSYSTSAIALEDSVICIIDKNDFFKVIENNSSLAFKIIRLFANELNEADLRLVNLTQKHVRARMADALLLVNDIYGADPENGALNVSLKRADMAALANMTTANAIRVLSSFAKENIIEVNRRKINIKNLPALNRVSNLGS